MGSMFGVGLMVQKTLVTMTLGGEVKEHGMTTDDCFTAQIVL